jgi:drug/metabolite transporter (DMT)-like permease
LSRPLIGLTLCLVTVFCGVTTGILVKQLSEDINVFSTMFYRFLFSLPLLFAYGFLLRGRKVLQINQRGALVFRTIFGCFGMFFWFVSIRSMPFGTATALVQSSALFVTLLSPLLLRESVGIYRWSAVVFGFIGVLIIADPFKGEISWVASYGLAAALAGAGLSLSLRQLGKGDEPVSVACWYNFMAFSVLCIVMWLVPGSFEQVDNHIWVDLAFLGLIAFGMQISITTAYRYCDAVVVASMRYIQMPVSAIFGYVIFTEVMSFNQIVGATIIIASCLVIGWRELVREKSLSEPSV